MKNLFVFLIIAVLANSVNAARVYSLYTDRRAVQEGDILTVLIVENAEANAKSSTNTKKKNSLGASAQPIGIKGLNVFPNGISEGGSLSADYDGSGATARTGKFVAKVSARIEQVLDNGNLIISGNKVVEINEEKEIINISGIVRPEDIEGNNTIYSYNIANAQITYSGKGSASSGQRPGPLARLFNWLF
ncbi:MAG: flagellar basal body L-ring protein FlgH [Chitinispirillales bacterium]|jgi:flagellar L-ring protein precursor FlgH|nr:flagellar basal body L-ring protein FlgH [Chitinispirillales bacterium]